MQNRLLPATLSPSARAFASVIQNAAPETPADAGLLAALCFHAVAEGHSCLDMSQLAAIFPRHSRLAELSLHSIFGTHPLVAIVTDARAEVPPALLVVFQNRLYLKKYWDLECRLIQCLDRRANEIVVTHAGTAGHDLAMLCMQKPLVLLTGGPGTGKTTAIAEALPLCIQAFHQRHGRYPVVRLCAPTGKAALRMSAALSLHLATFSGNFPEPVIAALPTTAQTLHRILRKHSMTGRSPYASEAPLSLDMLVLDEASMIDLPMLVATLEALPAHASVLLVGDPKQLPSVELGNVLGTLLSDPKHNVLLQRLAKAHRHLSHNHRQAESPGLAQLSRDMANGQNTLVLQHLQDNAYPGVVFQSAQHGGLSAVIRENIVHYRKLALHNRVEEALQQMEQRTLLCAVRRGRFGCETLNTEIQQQLSTACYQHGQVLLITENAPALGLANGDSGLVWASSGVLAVYFKRPDGIQRVALSALPRHELGYCLTVHKAQGSEYAQVDLILPSDDSPLLNKALLYTAVTRARSALNIIGSTEALKSGLETNPVRMNGLVAMAASVSEK